MRLCYSFICLCPQGQGEADFNRGRLNRNVLHTYCTCPVIRQCAGPCQKHMEVNKQFFCELVPITLFIRKQYMFKTGVALFALIVCVIMNNSFISSAFAASPPAPAFGTATVDGDASEWNLAEDGTGDFLPICGGRVSLRSL